MDTVPDIQLILGFKEFFRKDPPLNRLDIIKEICKENLIAEFAGLNYRLKPKVANSYDTSFEVQLKELKYFCRSNELLKKYAKTIVHYKEAEKHSPLIFTRQTCLFALEEVIQSDLSVVDNFEMDNAQKWDTIFKYLLIINTVITAIGKDSGDAVNFETLNPKVLPLNEQGLNSQLFNIPFRGLKLFKYLSGLEEIGEHLTKYFSQTYNMSYGEFVNSILKLYTTNSHEDETFDFYYRKPDSKLNAFLTVLSQKFESTDIYKLLNIRKYPFYRFKNGDYILVDNTMLLEKSYNQFINDFWFDYTKGLKNEGCEPQINIKRYKSIIGYFFESYINESMRYIFADAEHYKVRMFDDLKVNHKGAEVEIADLYVRYNKRVILGQVKATSLYDREKYSGNVDSLYKNNRNEFFKSFGIDQLFNSINILENKIQGIDAKFPVNKPYQVFPVIVVNENALQTQLMPKILQDRFSELVSKENKKVHVYPLSIIHVSDVERVEDTLHKDPDKIWDLLKFHCRNPKFMPPFCNSLDRKNIKTSTNRVRASFKELIEKCN